MRRALLLALTLLASGCGGSTSAAPAFDAMAKIVQQRSGHRVAWRTGGPEDRAVDDRLRALLGEELTPDGAALVALLNNRALQAIYEELSVGQADLVQAGLLSNPQLGLGLGFSNRAHARNPNVTVGIGWDFMSVFSRSARRKIAETELEAVKMRVGGAILQLTADVRAAYYTTEGATQMAGMRRLIAEAAQAAVELARGQHNAGNISDLDLAVQEGQYQQAKLDLARAEVEVRAAREQLTRLMGLWGTQSFRVPSKLPDVPEEEVSLGDLESSAVAQRLELAGARKEVEAALMMASLASQTRYLPSATAGANYEHRVVEQENTIGPTLGLEIPLFDQRQAVVARLDARGRQSYQRLLALATDVRSEVRLVRDRVVHLRQIADHFRTVMIPLRTRSVVLSQQNYDAMLLGVYQLLAAKQSEASTYREYIETVRDYWIARSDLERAVGGRIPGGAPGSAPGAAPAMDHPMPPGMDHSGHGAPPTAPSASPPTPTMPPGHKH